MGWGARREALLARSTARPISLRDLDRRHLACLSPTQADTQLGIGHACEQRCRLGSRNTPRLCGSVPGVRSALPQKAGRFQCCGSVLRTCLTEAPEALRHIVGRRITVHSVHHRDRFDCRNAPSRSTHVWIRSTGEFFCRPPIRGSRESPQRGKHAVTLPLVHNRRRAIGTFPLEKHRVVCLWVRRLNTASRCPNLANTCGICLDARTCRR